MNTQKSGLGYLIGTAAIAIVIGGGVFLYSKINRGQELTPLTAAQILPEETMMAGFIETDAERWSDLAQFKALPMEQWGTELQSQLLKSKDIDYAQDIQPWLGNVMVAVVPTQDNGETDVLVVMGVKDKVKALQFSQQLTEQLEQKPQESEYRGVTVWEATMENGENLSYGLVEDKLVLASQTSTVQGVIDAAQDGNSLGAMPENKALLSQDSGLSNPIAKFYLVNYGQLLTTMIAQSGEELPPETLDQLQQVESMVMSVGVEDRGLHLQAIANLQPGATDGNDLPPSQNRILERVPGDSLMVFNGADISQRWEQLVSQEDDIKPLAESLQQIRLAFSENTNLDLDRDVLGWMDGEFAMGIMPAQTGLLGDFGIGGLILLETGDRQTAENTIKKLEQLTITQLPPTIRPRQEEITGIAVTRWDSPDNKTAIAYGWLENNVLLITVGAAPTPLIDLQPNDSLAESGNFEEVTASLPDTNNGYFYINFEEAWPLIKALPGNQQNIPPQTKPLLDAIDGLALTTSNPNAETGQLDMMVMLKTQPKE